MADLKVFWINALLVRNDNKVTVDMVLPNGLKQNGDHFKYEGGSFTHDELITYAAYGTLDKEKVNTLSKRQKVALHIYCFKSVSLLEAFELADNFLEESEK